MSKEKKFHQLIEEQNQEEKAKAWEKIQEKMAEASHDLPVVVENKTSNVRPKWNWRKAVALGTAIVALGVSVFAVMEFIPTGDITVDEFSSENIQVETSDDDSSQNDNRYCTAEQYTSSTIDKTLKQYAQETGKNIRYFDWYDTTEEVGNYIYTLDETNEIICYRENIINPETGDSLTLYVIEKNIDMDFLQWNDGGAENVYTFNQVDIVWSFDVLSARATFEFADYKYNILLTEPMEEDDILEYAKLLLGE